MKTCKFPNKPCNDRYMSTRNNYTTPICRLDEWKKKKGICSYDSKIHSVSKKTKKAIKDKSQRTL